MKARCHTGSGLFVYPYEIKTFTRCGRPRRYSLGVREMCCREACGSDFRQAAEDLERVGQIRLTHEMLRQVVEAEARQAVVCQQTGGPPLGWTAADCRGSPQEPTCLITGADGVKVPLVTEAEKAKRRALNTPSKTPPPAPEPAYPNATPPKQRAYAWLEGLAQLPELVRCHHGFGLLISSFTCWAIRP